MLCKKLMVGIYSVWIPTVLQGQRAPDDAGEFTLLFSSTGSAMTGLVSVFSYFWKFYVEI